MIMNKETKYRMAIVTLLAAILIVQILILLRIQTVKISRRGTLDVNVENTSLDVNVENTPLEVQIVR